MSLATLGDVLGALYYLRPVPDLLAARTVSAPGTLRARVAVLLLAAVVVLFTVLPFLVTRLAAAGRG